jgi:hypothetical protein
MLADILNAANLYAEGVNHVQERREQWLTKHKELKDHLKEVAEYLNTNAAYKQGFYVDTLHAFDENINGTSASMPSITLRSGPMPMLVTFKNTMGEKKEYSEEGFHITLTPTITGQVIAFLLPHQSELNKTPPQYITLAVIDEPGKLTMEVADAIITKGIQIAFFSSFTGMGEQQQAEDANAAPLPAPHSRNPIGFKLHETTEEVK